MRKQHAHVPRQRWLTLERLIWAVLVGMNTGALVFLFTRTLP